MFDKGIFTISLDFELAWGKLDRPEWKSYTELYREEREYVIQDLLDLFERYRVQASWCTVGHLFLAKCDRHPSHPRSSSADRLRFQRDPGSNEQDAPTFYGYDLIRSILACPVAQEIGSHSFSHVLFSNPDCSQETARWELEACVRAADTMSVRLQSFTFPRNGIGHLNLLTEFGFKVFRGRDQVWYLNVPRRGFLHRAGHLIEILCAVRPVNSKPIRYAGGLWELPGSMLYTPSHGIRQYIPVSLRVLRARKGLRMAAQNKELFHLWFHPTDLAVRRKAMLDGLREILDTASELREQGKIEILSMGAVASRLEERQQLGEPKLTKAATE